MTVNYLIFKFFRIFFFILFTKIFFSIFAIKFFYFSIIFFLFYSHHLQYNHMNNICISFIYQIFIYGDIIQCECNGTLPLNLVFKGVFGWCPRGVMLMVTIAKFVALRLAVLRCAQTFL